MAGWRHFARHDGARESTVTYRVGSGVQIDTFDERRVQYPGPSSKVVQIRNGDTIEEVSDIARWGAAYVEIGQSAHNRHDTRQSFDGAVRVAKGPRHIVDFRTPELVSNRVALALHDDFVFVVLLGFSGLARRNRGLSLCRRNLAFSRWLDSGRHEPNQELNLRCKGLVTLHGRAKYPSPGGLHGLKRIGWITLDARGLGYTSILANDESKNHDMLAGCSCRVGQWREDGYWQ